MSAESSSLSKTLVVFGAASFLTLTILTASLPLNLPLHQESASLTKSYGTDTGSTAWLIVATIMNLFLSPALGYFYGLLTGYDITEYFKTFIITMAMITTLWITFTFSLVYGEDAWANQILGFPLTYYMFQNVGGAGYSLAPAIPINIFAIFELGYPLISAAILLSCLGGKVQMYGFLFFVLVWHICIWCPIAHITWHQRGFFYTNIIIDYSGGIVVNMVCSATAIGLYIANGYRRPKTTPIPHKNSAALLQALFPVWLLWFALDAGKAYSANAIASQSIANTIAASTAGVLTWFFTDLLFDRPTSPATLASAVVASLVAITPASGFLTIGGSQCLAIWSVLITYAIAVGILGEGKEANEPISVHSIHAIAGTIGFCFTTWISYLFINPNGDNGITYGRGIPFSHHLAAACAIWGSVVIVSTFLAFVSNLIFPIFISEDDGSLPPVVAESGDAVKEQPAEPAENLQLQNV